MRVFVPATTAILRRLLDTGELDAPLTGFAVTPSLREWYTEGDLEELEYSAFSEAARASLRLLDEDPTSARRRVVLSVEAPAEMVSPRPDLDRAVVEVGKSIPLGSVASAHVDDAAAEPAVTAAGDAVIAAELGSDDAQFLVDEAEGFELSWYATQEIGPLLELL